MGTRTTASVKPITTVRRLGVIAIVVTALTLAACTATPASLGTGQRGTLLIETSECAGMISPAVIAHPSHVNLTIQRLGVGELFYRVQALRKYRYSVPAGSYLVAEPGVTGERSVNATVENGRTTSVAVPNMCK